MARWQFVTQQRNGTPLADLTDLSARRLSFYLNRPGEVTGTLKLTSPQARRDYLQPGATELKVYRDGAALETVLQLATANVTLDDIGGSLELGWLGALSYLANGLVDANTDKTGKAQSLHAWELISTFQSRTGGDYGITRGLIPATDPVQGKVYAEPTEIKQAVEALSEGSPGFDFAINASRGFDVYYPTRGSDNGLVLEHGVNVSLLTLPEEAGPGTIVTDATVAAGPGKSGSASSADARVTYGRREAYIQDVQNTGTATDLATQASAAVSLHSAPQVIPEVRVDLTHPTTPWGAFWLGDTVRVRADLEQYLSVDDAYRIVAINVDLDEQDNEQVTLELNKVM